jgi:HK97 family phage major capsid protein
MPPIEYTYEELKTKLVADIKDPIVQGATTAILENEKMKQLFEAHQNYPIDPQKSGDEPVKYATTAKFFRALARDDKKTLHDIHEEEKKKYMKFFQWDEKTLTHYLTESDYAQGGYLVPIEYYGEIMRLPTISGVARRDCMIVPMTRALMVVPTLATYPQTYWIAPRAALEYRAKTVTKPTFSVATLDAVVQAAIVVFEKEVIADATPPLVEFVKTLMVEQFKIGEDNALFNGNGGAGITGVLAAGINVVMSGGNISFANITADDLLDLVDAVTAGSEQDGKYYLNKNILTHIRKLKDTQGQYIWNAPANGAPGTIWGYPYETVPVMPGNGASAIDTSFVVFGNFKRCVMFGDRQALTIDLADQATVDSTSLWQYNLIALRFEERLDIEVALAGGIARLTTAHA